MVESRDFRCLLSKVLSGPRIKWSSMTFMHHKSHRINFSGLFKRKKKQRKKKARNRHWIFRFRVYDSFVLSTSRGRRPFLNYF